MSQFILAIILLLLSFSLKLYVNREVTKPSLLAAIAELPVDVMFISTAFTISHQLLYSNQIIESFNNGTKETLDKIDLNAGFGLFGLYILISIFIVAFWRVSVKKMDGENWGNFTLCLGINYIICITALLFALSKLNEVL